MPKLSDPTAFDRDPSNILILEKSWWKSRITDERRKSHIVKIVNFSYDILINKIAGRSIIVNNEASLQMHLAQIINIVGKLYEFESDDLFHIELEGMIPLEKTTPKNLKKKSRADILIALGKGQFFSTCAIELKFFKKKNHREPRNRYDIYAELYNLEQYKKTYIDECFLIVATDHRHYLDQEKFEPQTKEFDTRDGYTYEKCTQLEYHTANPPGFPITLDNTITFKWDRLPIWGRALENLFCLKIHI